MIERLNVMVERLSHDATLPVYAHYDDAGMDLFASEDWRIEAGTVAMIPTGIAMAIREGYVGLIHPRSGLASKGVTVMNAPGTIDSGYRGEIRVLLYNSNNWAVQIHKGDRIAQIVFQQYVKATLLEVNHLPDSLRGESGFGSTGV